jgi:hypothetical protein
MVAVVQTHSPPWQGGAGREAAGVARSVSPIGRNIKKCSKSHSNLIDARAALLINRYCSTFNRQPQPSRYKRTKTRKSDTGTCSTNVVRWG